MLTMQAVDDDVAFYGHGLSGSAAVQELQQALRELAQAAGWPAVDPGTITGVADSRLVRAVGSVLPNLAGLDGRVKQALTAALFAADRFGKLDEAAPYIAQYATYLTGAVRLLISKYGKGTAPPLQPAGRKLFVSPAAIEAQAAAVAARTGAITARSAAGAWRVALPATQLGRALGAAYKEVAPQASQPAGAEVVSEYTFNLKTGSLAWYKDWRYLVPIGVGTAAVAGLGVWWWRR
jgi:hypothetical protein